MIFVAGSGLLVVKDGTFGDAPMIRVQFFRFGGDCRQGDSLLVLAKLVDALSGQVNGALSLRRVNLLLKPYWGITLWLRDGWRRLASRLFDTLQWLQSPVTLFRNHGPTAAYVLLLEGVLPHLHMTPVAR